jgi:hypothetical protein
VVNAVDDAVTSFWSERHSQLVSLKGSASKAERQRDPQGEEGTKREGESEDPCREDDFDNSKFSIVCIERYG